MGTGKCQLTLPRQKCSGQSALEIGIVYRQGYLDEQIPQNHLCKGSSKIHP
jgi:hypothetical protein